MVAPLPIHGIFLVLGPARPHWPEPLASLISSGRIRVEVSASIHEISARLAAGDPAVHALLFDPQVLTLRHLQAVAVINRFIRLPLVLLPLVQGASIRAKEAPHFGIMPWDQAAPALASFTRVSQCAPGHVVPPSGGPPALASLTRLSQYAPPALTDNDPLANAADAAENSLTLDAANRYDELGTNPLISPQEMAALLGVNE